MKKLLLVIDFQNDFVSGSLSFPGAEKLEAVIARKIEAYKNNGDDVIFTLDTHGEDYLESVEGKYLPVRHCIKGSSGHELYGRVKELAADCLVFEKPTFPSLELANHLRGKDYGVIEVCGLVSNICVLSNAIMAKAALPNAEVVVDVEATASNDPDLNEKCFDIMESLHIQVLNRN